MHVVSIGVHTSDRGAHVALHGQRQAEHVEGVKAARLEAAGAAAHLGLELPVEQLRHDGLVALRERGPRLCR